MEENNNLTAKEFLALAFPFFFLFFLIYFGCEAFGYGFNYIMFIHFLILACVFLGFFILFIFALINYVISYFKERKKYFKDLEAENKLLFQQNARLIIEKDNLMEQIYDRKDI